MEKIIFIIKKKKQKKKYQRFIRDIKKIFKYKKIGYNITRE